MAELNGKKIYEKLDTIEDKINTILLWQGTHEKSHEFLERDIADNRAAIFKNPGLISKVNTLLNGKSTVTERRRFWLEILKYLIITGIVAVATWLLLLYKMS